MPVFEYKGLTSKGKSVGGIVNADSARSARTKLRRDGVFPTELTEQRSSSAEAKAMPSEPLAMCSARTRAALWNPWSPGQNDDTYSAARV